jgi:RNA polymerase sigma-70 factor (ECF subfamily)
MDDNAIVEMFWRRSEDALVQTAGRFGAYCRRIAMNILDNDSDADECVNDTWLRAWNAIPPARPTHLKAFLGRITRNLALDHYTAQHAARRGGGSVMSAFDELAEIAAPDNADEGEVTRVINRFLRLEPQRNADIFIKRYWYLLPTRRIAAEYGFSEGKVLSLLFRMRQRLRAELESEGLL